MKNTVQQQIINFIDENELVTFSQLSAKFDQFGLMAFEELLQDGQVRQVVANKLLGTYKYCLAA